MRSSLRAFPRQLKLNASPRQTLSSHAVGPRFFSSARPLTHSKLSSSSRPLPTSHRQSWQQTTPTRHNTTLTAPSPPSPSSGPSSDPSPSSPPPPKQPTYEMYFTCRPCSHRSGPHRISKQGYHHGSTLITCPACHARHVISDHLCIFTDAGGDLEAIMRENGGKLKRGRLGIREGSLVGNEGEEGIEFWEDGTETVRGGAGAREGERERDGR